MVKKIKMEDVRKFEENYGEIVDFYKVDLERDVVFKWKGKKYGVRVKKDGLIKDERKGMKLWDEK